MNNKVKDIDIKKSHILLSFFNGVLNIAKFGTNNIKIGEKSCNFFLIYYIGYVTIKYSKYVKIYCVNPLYLVFKQVNGYFEEINGNKYLTLVPSNKIKEKNKKIWRTVD